MQYWGCYISRTKFTCIKTYINFHPVNINSNNIKHTWVNNIQIYQFSTSDHIKLNTSIKKFNFASDIYISIHYTISLLNSKKKISQSSNTSNKVIRIIDNIPKDLQANNSNLIKKIIKEATNEETLIDCTYTLPKGGIAIHLLCEEDAKKLENNLDKIYPGSHCQQPQSHSDYSKVIVKNLDPSIPTQKLKQNMEEAYQTTIQIKRYHSSLTKRPLLTPCITFKGDIYSNFLSEETRIFNESYKCQPYNKPAIRCFNCQKFGPIARNCRNRKRCHNCGETHLQNSYC